MAQHTFDRGGEDDGIIDVSLFTFYGEEYVWTDLTPAVGGYGLSADGARAYAADLIAHADALDERNRRPVVVIHGMTDEPHGALKHAALQATTRPPAAPQRRYTVLVARRHEECEYWCRQNRRNPRDRSIVRIVNAGDEYRLQGIGDFDLVLLSPCANHYEVMALINQRRVQLGMEPV
jgi:hypothetical protein